MGLLSGAICILVLFVFCYGIVAHKKSDEEQDVADQEQIKALKELQRAKKRDMLSV